MCGNVNIFATKIYKPKSKKMDVKKILLTVAVAAVTTIALDFVLPLKQNADGSLTRIAK